MKILLLIRSLNNGGAEGQLSLLASYMPKLNYDVTVLTFYKHDLTNRKYKFLINNNIKVISVNKKHRYDIFGFFKRLINIVRAEKPNVIYSFLELANVFSAIIKLIDKKILIIWGKRSSDLNLRNYRLSIFLEHKFEKLLLPFCNLIIANSNKVYESLINKKYPNKKIAIIENAIDIERFNKDNIPKNNLFANLNINDNDFLIGTVGRIEESKDYITLINCAKIIINENDNIKFIIIGKIGDEKYYKSLIKLINQYQLTNKFFILSEINDIEKFYSNIDIYVSSSQSEGFSNVILEAMAMQIPCIITNVGAYNVLQNEACIVVNKKNPEELALAILKLMNKDIINLGNYARKYVKENFSIEVMAKKTDFLIKKLYETSKNITYN